MSHPEILSEFETLNRFAQAGGVVLFGSTSAAHLPLNELIQDFGLNRYVYNRSVADMTIADAESYIRTAICPLAPEKLLLNLGEVELHSTECSIDTLIEQYQWLLYQIHTMLPKTRIVLISVSAQTPNAIAFNLALKKLCSEYGCEYADSPAGAYNGDYAICFFHAIKSFFYDRTMSLSEALHYCAV